MSNLDITRLVVGESLAIDLGRPVGQNIKPQDVSKILRLKNGRWEGATGGVAGLLRKGRRRRSHTFSIQSARQWAGWPWVKLAAALGALTVAGAALGVIYSQSQANGSHSIPVVSAETQGVRIVDQPFAQAEPELQTIVRADAPAQEPQTEGRADIPIGLPIVPPVPEAKLQADTQMPVAAPAPASQPPRTRDLSAGQPSVTKQPSQPPSTKADEQPKPPAVILFDDISAGKPRPAPAPAAPATAPTAQRKPESDSKPQASAAPEPKAKGSGLVAITPDGKSAIFTNPQTRLPEQFKLGEKLQNGEVIKGIDAAQGKVITNAKEYSLE